MQNTKYLECMLLSSLNCGVKENMKLFPVRKSSSLFWLSIFIWNFPLFFSQFVVFIWMFNDSSFSILNHLYLQPALLSKERKALKNPYIFIFSKISIFNLVKLFHSVKIFQLFSTTLLVVEKSGIGKVLLLFFGFISSSFVYYPREEKKFSIHFPPLGEKFEISMLPRSCLIVIFVPTKTNSSSSGAVSSHSNFSKVFFLLLEFWDFF